ncbi:phosphocholine phosphatase [Aureococcus anophagefferens]|nr:phosphocholine phosphatase [Aureococcus anophagefferens]
MSWLSRCAGASKQFESARTQEGPTMVVWDFDWSLINENSDTWILEQLAPTLLTDLKKLQQTEPDRFGRGQWTALMDHLLTLLGTREKVTRGALERRLASIPFADENVACVRLAAAAGCEQRILSDANEVYIDKILEARSLRARSAVCTNAATHEAAGDGAEVLRVAPFHPVDEAPHGCRKCPPNLGDYCPATRLVEDDVVCARANYPLAKKLRKLALNVADPVTLDAAVAEWRDGADLLRIFKRELRAPKQAAPPPKPPPSKPPPSKPLPFSSKPAAPALVGKQAETKPAKRATVRFAPP